MVLLPVELALALEDELLDESDEEDDELLLDELLLDELVLVAVVLWFVAR